MTATRDMRDAMVDTFCAAAARGVSIAVVVSDSTSTAKIAPFAKAHPQRLVNVGIAEQDLVGVATGMALGGFVAFTCNAASFLLGRAAEQVRNDVCYSRANVKLVGLNAGVCYGPLGSTHHAIEDLALLRAFGNIEIYAPADATEAQAIFEYAIAHEGPVYIRMDSAALPVLHGPDYRFTPGGVDRLVEGSDVTICAVGSTVSEAVDASRRLAEEGISAGVLNVSSVRPLRREQIVEAARRTGRVVTVEEHSLAGGLGSLVCETLMEAGAQVQIRRLGFPEGEFPKAGPRGEMRAYYRIDAAGVAGAAREIVQRQN